MNRNGAPARHGSNPVRNRTGEYRPFTKPGAAHVSFWHNIVPAPVSLGGTDPEARGAVIHAPFGARNT